MRWQLSATQNNEFILNLGFLPYTDLFYGFNLFYIWLFVIQNNEFKTQYGLFFSLSKQRIYIITDFLLLFSFSFSMQ